MTDSDRDMAFSVSESGEFLAEYTAWLWGCGATAIRIEKNVGRIARALGFDMDLTLLPHHIELGLGKPDTGERIVIIRKVAQCGVSFDINARLSRLSWEIADGKVGFAEAKKRFGRIMKTPPTGRWEVLRC